MPTSINEVNDKIQKYIGAEEVLALQKGSNKKDKKHKEPPESRDHKGPKDEREKAKAAVKTLQPQVKENTSPDSFTVWNL